MSEKNHSRDITGDPYNLEGLSNTELLAEMDRLIGTMPEDDFDEARIDAIESLLKKRAPIEPYRDAETSLADFLEKHKTLVETMRHTQSMSHAAADPRTPKHHKPKLRRGVAVAAAIIGIVIIGTAIASAAGLIPSFKIVFGEESIRIGQRPSGKLELPEGSDNEYISLRDMMESNGDAYAELVKWIPVEYSLEELSMMELDWKRLYIAIFASQNNTQFSIRISTYNENEFNDMEKSEDGVPYPGEGGRFRVTTNKERTVAYWSDGVWMYFIEGNLTEKDVKQMIDSINER